MIHNGLIDAFAELSGVKHLPWDTTKLSALAFVEAHAGLFIVDLSFTAHAAFFRADFRAVLVAFKIILALG